jgi:hypothetical protein
VWCSIRSPLQSCSGSQRVIGAEHQPVIRFAPRLARPAPTPGDRWHASKPPASCNLFVANPIRAFGIVWIMAAHPSRRRPRCLGISDRAAPPEAPRRAMADADVRKIRSASRVVVAKLRLDGTPTPRWLGGSDDEAASTIRCGQERLRREARHQGVVPWPRLAELNCPVGHSLRAPSVIARLGLPRPHLNPARQRVMHEPGQKRDGLFAASTVGCGDHVGSVLRHAASARQSPHDDRVEGRG